MNNKKIMNQTVEDMTPEELIKALTIKIKDVEPAGSELKVGDKVEIVEYWVSHDKITDNAKRYNGQIGELINLNTNKNYPYQVKTDDGTSIPIHEVKLVKPKAIWKDITKECEFKPRLDNELYLLQINHKGRCIGHLQIDEEPYITAQDCKCKRHNGYFKILKKDGNQ